MGLNEDSHDITEILGDVEPSIWWAKVRARFDGVRPEMVHHLRVPTPGSEVVWAMQFATDQAPYVVNRQQSDSFIAKGVPWRESASTRPATQFQVHRSLQPIAKLPVIEPVWAQVKVGVSAVDGGMSVITCGSEMRIAILPREPTGTTLLLEGHSEIQTSLLSGPSDNLSEFMTLSSEVWFEVLAGSNGVSEIAGGVLALTGVGLVHLRSSAESESMGPRLSPGDIPALTTAVRIDVTLDGVGLPRPVHVSAMVDREVQDRNPDFKFLSWGKP